VEAAMTKPPCAGWVPPKSELMEIELKKKSGGDIIIQEHVKTEAEIQAKLEQDRGWVRSLNAKLIDRNIARLMEDSSNGSDWLKSEIKRSGGRL
jgi:hypothetical protein